LDEIAGLEADNLRLIQLCDEIGSEKERNVMKLKEDIGEAEHQSVKLRGQTNRLRSLTLLDTRAQQIAKDTDNADDILNGLTVLVQKYYRSCFSQTAEINALMMLERLELELEAMYTISASLSPQYLIEKQAAIEKLRREEQRRQKQEAQELEQQRKKKAALERSVQPVHMKVGRPVVPRMWPESGGKRDMQKGQHDEQIQEQMLFGAIED
jgi:hypothetical protein